MSNTYFRFKHFTIHQDRCAMKVCTDSCLFGAWLNRLIQKDEVPVIHALDIGSGTGLLSMMLAQEYAIDIDAVEIDAAAYLQSVENVSQASLKGRIQFHHQSISDFETEKKYEFIFSNPPFFSGDLKSSNPTASLAKHESDLNLSELVSIFRRLKNKQGFFAVLLPYHRRTEMIGFMQQDGFSLMKEVAVRQTPAHDFFRTMMLFSEREGATAFSELSIRKVDGGYGDTFTELLKSYYLAF